MLLPDRVNRDKLKWYYPRDSDTQEVQQPQDLDSGHQEESDNLPANPRTMSTHLTNFLRNCLPTVPGAQEGILIKDFPEDQESRNPEFQERKTTRRCIPGNQEREGEEVPGHQVQEFWFCFVTGSGLGFVTDFWFWIVLVLVSFYLWLETAIFWSVSGYWLADLYFGSGYILLLSSSGLWFRTGHWFGSVVQFSSGPSQVTRKEAQNHELIKNEKKMKEQIKYEDARYQKLNTSYNTVKNTLTVLLQNQEPATAAPSTLDSAALNTLAALQAELQTEKLQRQLLVSRFMSQTAQHKAKVKQLKEELAKAKADLQAVGSLASTSHIQQAETHVPIQLPQLPEMPEFQGTEEEEQQRPAPGALDIREEIEQEVEDMPEGPTKEYLRYEKKVMQSAALAFLQPDEQVKDFGTDFLPLPLMRIEAILWKEKMRPAVPRNEDGGYEGIPLTTEEAKTLIEDHPRWRRKWLSERPRDLTNFHNTPQALQIDPSYCPVPRRRSWAEFQKWKGKNKALLNYLVLSAQEPPTVNYVVNTLNTTIQLLRDVPNIACQMLVKIARMIVTCIQVFKDTEDDDHPWN
ncbi:hypothetical protein L7F22_000613 [Adiantum nelumboides]|nr:hypothetical protein [Adiantum nelumboides]